MIGVDAHAGVELVDAPGKFEAGPLVFQRVKESAKEPLILTDPPDRARRGEGLAERPRRDGDGLRVGNGIEHPTLEPGPHGRLGDVEESCSDGDRDATSGFIGSLHDGREVTGDGGRNGRLAQGRNGVRDIHSERDVRPPITTEVEHPGGKGTC